MVNSRKSPAPGKRKIDVEVYRRHVLRARGTANHFTFSRDFVGPWTRVQAMFLQDLINRASLATVDEEGYFLCMEEFLEAGPGGWEHTAQNRMFNLLIEQGIVHIKHKGIPGKRWVFIDLVAVEERVDDYHNPPTSTRRETSHKLQKCNSSESHKRGAQELQKCNLYLKNVRLKNVRPEEEPPNPPSGGGVGNSDKPLPLQTEWEEDPITPEEAEELSRAAEDFLAVGTVKGNGARGGETGKHTTRASADPAPATDKGKVVTRASAVTAAGRVDSTTEKVTTPAPEQNNTHRAAARINRPPRLNNCTPTASKASRTAQEATRSEADPQVVSGPPSATDAAVAKLARLHWPVTPEDGDLHRLLHTSVLEYSHFRENLTKYQHEDRPHHLRGLARRLLAEFHPDPLHFCVEYISNRNQSLNDWEPWLGTPGSCAWNPLSKHGRKVGRSVALAYTGDADDYDRLMRSN